MRIPYAPICGVLAGAVATFAVAGAAHIKPTSAAPTCACALSAAHTRHHVRLHVYGRAHAHGWRHTANWSGHDGGMMDHVMVDHHMWRDEQQLSEGHGWSEDDGRLGYGHGGPWDLAWAERPWATDRYGYLTWPGKTHFVNGHAEVDDMPPPPEGAGPPPTPMEGWPGPPPPGADGDGGQSFEIYRF